VAVFVNGLLKAPTDLSIKQKRWADTRGIQTTNALFYAQPASSSPTQLDPSESVEELGDFLSKEDKEYKLAAEKDKFRVSWNVERRCFLNQTSSNAFRDQVLKSRYWPIEILRSSVPTGVKGKKEEDLNMSYHGVCYVDMQPLLYPGSSQIRGAYKIYPYSEADFTSKTKKKTGIADEALRTVGSLFDRNFAALPIKKEQKVVDKKDAKKVVKDSAMDAADSSQSAQHILDSKSYIVIDIKFDKPLIARKPFETLVKK
jgi:hypothetical protein